MYRNVFFSSFGASRGALIEGRFVIELGLVSTPLWSPSFIASKQGLFTLFV